MAGGGLYYKTTNSNYKLWLEKILFAAAPGLSCLRTILDWASQTYPSHIKSVGRRWEPSFFMSYADYKEWYEITFSLGPLPASHGHLKIWNKACSQTWLYCFSLFQITHTSIHLGYSFKPLFLWFKRKKGTMDTTYGHHLVIYGEL